MEVKLRKLWPLVGALCVTAFSSAFAQSNYSSGSDGNGSSMDSSSGSAKSGQGTHQRGTFREITPNAGPRVAHGADVFITADFIWWKTVQDGTQYATTGIDTDQNAPAATPFQNTPKGKAKSIATDWSPGFKVGLGLNLSHDGWDLSSEYTWLHAKNSNSISSSSIDAAGNVVPQVVGQTMSFTDAGFLLRAEGASSKWDMHFNVIDLELGRNFYLSQYLTMRPFIGLKGTWQDQSLNTSFNSTSFEIDVVGGDLAVTGPLRQNSSFDVWGIGLRSGLNLGWYMSKSFSFYGNLAFTSMWTEYYNQSRKDVMDDSTTGNSKTELHISNDSYYTMKYVTEMELGLRWETWFYDDNYHFAIQAGWEQQIWTNWGQFIQLVDQTNHDLTLGGLNVQLRFDF